ncbi:unnamed protein product [Mycena citricolor]|uniref:Uncharacterized protein n=1 Tax=Mycena citricolor TaxID=2018698 RepID=A0AAD2H122_9AGAR|nr:unnamed protein product [Mycena citricolor]
MHPALEVAEIRNLICEAVERDELKGLLAVLAQTCRAFFQPAIEALWASVELGDWLRYTMPEDVWDAGLDSRILSPRRDIVPQDWTRSVIYGTCIRDLACPSSGGSALDVAQALGAILTCPPPGTCLVSLKSLTWHQNNLTAMRPFLGPKLTSLHIWSPCLEGSTGENMLFLSEVSHRFAKTMRDVGLHFDTSDDDGPADLLSSAFAGYEDLRSASAHLANQRTLVCLGALPRLQSLSTTFVTNIEDLAMLSVDTAFFPALEMLDLQSVTQAEAILFLSTLTRSPLSALGLGLKELVLNSAFENLISTVRSCPASELRILDISSSDHPEGGDLWSLGLLCSPFFSSLTRIYIKSHVGFDITNDSLSALAQNLPRLLDLWLWTADPGGKLVTLPCLATFAEHCRSLRTLKIPLDARDAPRASSLLVSPPFPRQMALRELMVLKAGIEHPSDVAAYLNMLFGALTTITTRADERDGASYDGADEDSWTRSYWREVHR